MRFLLKKKQKKKNIALQKYKDNLQMNNNNCKVNKIFNKT